MNELPDDWANDQAMRCDVLFLFPDVDRPSILDELEYRPEIEDVRRVPGAAIRRIYRKDAGKSGLVKVAGTPLYKSRTIRNCNTARKLLELTQG